MISTYQEVVSKVQTMSYDEQYKLLQQLMIFLSEPVKDSKQKNILELQGLGKEIWNNIDAQKYVDRERDSWNG